jgi:hypothetical protein
MRIINWFALVVTNTGFRAGSKRNVTKRKRTGNRRDFDMNEDKESAKEIVYILLGFVIIMTIMFHLFVLFE